ncbi:class IV adenylate cyclase [Natranaerobius thermophilus]|uniref:Adenylate cyclase n=1 Tax=Natranaerobius thermophilus (strain ATCC BAA-1301 / DSM 18059 / JW/NM-WN-LF) TaxID=457570 RepID=B2A120_NATTJ|nr:class IV adenylate cyclase [Natranaerobius thermophilus]ACB84643.1 adenylate cyclase [Natranaerobius thermophilus JW/NM-WN-LF]
MTINIEIKAKCSNPEKVREILKVEGAIYKGIDHQVDTYFNVNNGRLKLREGTIENNLISYQREEKKGPKESDYILYKTEPNTTLKDVLIRSLGIHIVVDKQREIYFIDNLKFHIDSVENLGNFIEIEAIDKGGSIGKEKLLKQCKQYMNLFGVCEEDLLSNSYSDLLEEVSYNKAKKQNR